MKALLRTLLLWFLLAGVPFQGFASAAMLLCGVPATVAPASIAMTHEATHGAAGGAADFAKSGAESGAEYGAGHDHAAMLAAQGGDHGTGHHDGADDHTRCGGTSACCTGAPLAPALPVAPPSQDGRFATVPFVLTAPAAVDLAGPERPPKTLSA